MKRKNFPGIIEIRTFGGLTFYRQNLPIAIQWDSQKARLLFCYLLITSDQWVHRNQLIDLLWPGCNFDTGFKNFKTTLSRLRRSLFIKDQINPVLAQGDAYRINFESFSCDCEELRNSAVNGIRLMARGFTEDAKPLLERVCDLYTAKFLPEEPDDEFISNARNELFDLYSTSLRQLKSIYESEESFDLLSTLQNLAPLPVC